MTAKVHIYSIVVVYSKRRNAWIIPCVAIHSIQLELLLQLLPNDEKYDNCSPYSHCLYPLHVMKNKPCQEHKVFHIARCNETNSSYFMVLQHVLVYWFEEFKYIINEARITYRVDTDCGSHPIINHKVQN